MVFFRKRFVNAVRHNQREWNQLRKLLYIRTHVHIPCILLACQESEVGGLGRIMKWEYLLRCRAFLFGHFSQGD